ncbi:MAG: hypothetical protein K0U36_02335 [Alphaproteobacteria bacterium]|nr:hypothetical protein [Alphaproteobacteria bacterium]
MYGSAFHRPAGRVTDCWVLDAAPLIDTFAKSLPARQAGHVGQDKTLVAHDQDEANAPILAVWTTMPPTPDVSMTGRGSDAPVAGSMAGAGDGIHGIHGIDAADSTDSADAVIPIAIDAALVGDLRRNGGVYAGIVRYIAEGERVVHVDIGEPDMLWLPLRHGVRLGDRVIVQQVARAAQTASSSLAKGKLAKGTWTPTQHGRYCKVTRRNKPQLNLGRLIRWDQDRESSDASSKDTPNDAQHGGANDNDKHRRTPIEQAIVQLRAIAVAGYSLEVTLSPTAAALIEQGLGREGEPHARADEAGKALLTALVAEATHLKTTLETIPQRRKPGVVIPPPTLIDTLLRTAHEMVWFPRRPDEAILAQLATYPDLHWRVYPGQTQHPIAAALLSTIHDLLSGETITRRHKGNVYSWHLDSGMAGHMLDCDCRVTDPASSRAPQRATAKPTGKTSQKHAGRTAPASTTGAYAGGKHDLAARCAHALDEGIQLCLLHRLGGVVLIDPPGRPSNSEQKGILSMLQNKYRRAEGLTILGFGPAGMLELVLTRDGAPLRTRIAITAAQRG